MLLDPFSYAVVDLASGRAVGIVTLMEIRPAMRVIEIGNIVYRHAAAADRGRDRGAVSDGALRLRDARLPALRMEVQCAQRAVAAARAERLGFTFEGIFRQHMIVKGRNRDTAWYAMLDGEWPARKAAFERWLAPENFDEARQAAREPRSASDATVAIAAGPRPPSAPMRIRRPALALLLASVAPCVGQDSRSPSGWRPTRTSSSPIRRSSRRAMTATILKVEYDRPRDLYARDVERRQEGRSEICLARHRRGAGRPRARRSAARPINYVGVGATAGGAKAIVVFVHGRGTDRFSGTNDWIHGGNFNRIKNLMMLNGGVYLSPSFPDFDAKGADTVAALVLHYAALSPGAPVILACASWGGKICWRLVRDPDVGPLVSGLMLSWTPT